MTRPRMVDLFCGAGGASVGYHRAGFDVVGVDIAPQPHYPFEFHQGDARAFNLDGFDVVHASPPGHSNMSKCRPGLAKTYEDLVGETRGLLDNSGLPYVIENVVGAPMRADLTLCGQMFGLALYRHRLFESNVVLEQPEHLAHVIPGGRAGHWRPGQIISVSGHCAPISVARAAMGIDWMNRAELAEAVPPAYAQEVGQQLMWQLFFEEKVS